MKKSVPKRLIGLALAMLMVISMVACAKTETSNPGGTPDAPKTEASGNAAKSDIVTLQVFCMTANKSGIIDSWWNELLKEKVGVEIDLLPAGDDKTQKLQALLASGELPDIVVFPDKKNVTDSIRGNLLLDLGEHLDKLPNVVKNAPVAIQFARDQMSNDTGKLYAVGGFVGPGENGQECNWGPYMRWDLYKQLGMPKVDKLEDYLPLVKQMQELYPETEEGQKVYGFSLFGDWDGNEMLMATQPSVLSGIDTGDQMARALPFLQVDFVNGTTKSILDEDSEYIRALKFYYEANQMGLMDPDSLTQRFDTAKEKANEGRVLFSWWPWFTQEYDTRTHQDADPPTGYRPVLTSDYKAFYWAENPVGMWDYFSIGAVTKELDACLRFIDFMYSTDGIMEFLNGPEGVTWEYDENGAPVNTDFGWDAWENEAEMPGGGYVWDSVDDFNAYGISEGFINPVSNEPIKFHRWESSKSHDLTNLKKIWSDDVGGYKTVTDMLMAENKYTMIPFSINLIPELPDDIQSLADSIGTIVKTNSWLMVFAKDQAEFDKYYNEMVEKANGLGIDKIIEWDKKAYQESVEIAQKYK